VGAGDAPRVVTAEVLPPPLPRPQVEAQAIRIVPLVMNVIFAAIARFFRRLLGRQPA
jgi:hypothetical protein